LCGLELGKDFEIIDSSHARGGKIYDPDSGNTYDVTMIRPHEANPACRTFAKKAA
jgi:hypothetical protein